MNGAQILLACLLEQEVDTVFGYPGGSVIPLYDALFAEKHIRHIRTAHEQGAVHAADGYARSTGKTGVCFATSGPGASNTVTGIATAFMDSVPLVVITGQVGVPLLGKDSFQEIDITGMTLSITKHNYLVRDVDQLADTVREAFKVARSGRPGPVLIDVPKNIFLTEGAYESKDVSDSYYEIENGYREDDLKKAVELINKSQKPIICAGGGVRISGTENELVKLAEKADIPVINTLMGLGTIPYYNELSLGMVGMHGLRQNNLAASNCDLFIAIGTRLSDRVVSRADSFAKKAKVIHIDADITEIGKNVRADIPLQGNLKEILTKITDMVEKNRHSEWKSEIKAWKKSSTCENEQFNPENIIRSFCERLGNDTIVATDVGQHQMWTAQYWKFNSSHILLTSGGLGTMGFGMGAAIGAKLGNKNKQVLLITGDGSFRMNNNELATIARYNLPVTILLMNNNALGMVRQWQELFNEKRYSETDVDNKLDYVKLADAYGIEGHLATSMSDLEELLGKCEFGKKPIFIECRIQTENNVYPIVPPGAAIADSIDKQR